MPRTSVNGSKSSSRLEESCPPLEEVDPARQAVQNLLEALRYEFKRLEEHNHELCQEIQQLKLSGPLQTKGSSTTATNEKDWHVTTHRGDDALSNHSAAPSGKSENSGKQEEEEQEHYEKVYDLSLAFTSLCAPHKQRISVGELLAMVANQRSIAYLDPRINELRDPYTEALKELNAFLNISPAEEINLDTFMAIMQRNKSFFSGGRTDVISAISQIRDILVKEDAHRKVAKANNITALDLHNAKRPTQHSRSERVLKTLDPLIGVVIIMNAIIIYVSTDYAPNAQEWQWVEASFTIVFLLEFLVKLAVQGRAFCSCNEKYWNIFDGIVCTVASADLLFSVISTFENLRNFTVVRLLRFARLTKLVRVLKLKIFKELTLMVNGIFAGVRTLVWAVVFLFFLLFVLGVLLTQSVGRAGFIEQTDCGHLDGTREGVVCVRSVAHLVAHRQELFGTVLRSAFTVFRCITDGCASVDGTPLVPYFYNTHGFYVISMYMVVILFVMFGLFNLIMAIFVETTIANAGSANAKRYEARFQEDLQIAKRLQDVIEMFCIGEWPEEEEPKPGWISRVFSTSTSEGAMKKPNLPVNKSKLNLSVTVSHDTFNKVLRRQDVQRMLDDLDIAPNNRESLFDILDANNDGSLEVAELVQGLLKLRGSADKGEVVAALLAIRSMQKSIKAMQAQGLEHGHVIENIANGQHRLEAHLRAHHSMPGNTRHS